MQLLGIGLDGHIGFNEPDKYFVKTTHVVDLHESTIKANSRFFANIDEVPRRAITMGMVSIMQAKEDFADCKRQGKAGYSGKSLLRTDNPRNPRLDSSTPP